MNQDFITIEAVFQEAVFLQLFINRENPMAAMVLVFENQHEGGVEYMLLDKNHKYNVTAILEPKNDEIIDFSLVHTKTGDAINVKGLKYKKEEFDAFIDFVGQDRAVLFMIGYWFAGRIVITATDKNYQPFILNGYGIKKSP